MLLHQFTGLLVMEVSSLIAYLVMRFRHLFSGLLTTMGATIASV